MKLLVVNHHYIREEKYKNGIYPITPANLEANIKLLLNKGWTPADFDVIVNFFNSGKPPNKKYFIFTFDDGLKCQLDNGIKILEKFSISAIFFIPTCILKGKELSVHKLHYIRSRLKDKDILTFVYKTFPALEDFKTDENILRKHYRYDNLLSARLKYLLNFILAKKEKKREELINTLLSRLMNRKDFVNKTYMNNAEIKYLSEKYWVGTHGHSHRPLSQLSLNEIKNDIITSLNVLKEITGKEIEAVSYPHSGPSVISKKVVDVCRTSALKIGFTMERRINTIEDFHLNPLTLGRIDVNDLKDFLKKEILSGK